MYGKGGGAEDRGGQGTPGRAPEATQGTDVIANLSAVSPLQGCRVGSGKVWPAFCKALPGVWITDWEGQEWNP